MGIVIAFFILIIVLVLASIPSMPIFLWNKAKSMGIDIRFTNLIGMNLRKVNSREIIKAMMKAKEAGIDLQVEYVEAHFLGGGRPDRLVQILIDAQDDGIDLSFKDACIIDYEGYDFPTYKKEHGLQPKL